MRSSIIFSNFKISFFLSAVTEDITVEEIDVEGYDYAEDIEIDEQSREEGKNMHILFLHYKTEKEGKYVKQVNDNEKGSEHVKNNRKFGRKRRIVCNLCYYM